MKKVICTNNKNLPEGAWVEEDIQYEVENEYINALDQRVYIIKGAVNEGITKMGMRWIGYNANRFSLSNEDTKAEYAHELESNFMYN
jgi:hypothetical protein